MKRARIDTLKAKGWRSGSAAEFLGLSREESYFVELKVTLADELRKRRARRKITQQQLAALIGSSQSRVAKMERGDASVSLDLLFRSLLAMGAKPKDLGRSIAA
jgi:DNA-binding XRE family transcriptional regulator